MIKKTKIVAQYCLFVQCKFQGLSGVMQSKARQNAKHKWVLLIEAIQRDWYNIVRIGLLNRKFTMVGRVCTVPRKAFLYFRREEGMQEATRGLSIYAVGFLYFLSAEK